MINKIIDWIKQNGNKIILKDVWTEDGWRIIQYYGLTEYAKQCEADFQAGKYKHRIYPYIIHPGVDYTGKSTGEPVRVMHDAQIVWAGTNRYKKSRGIYVSAWDMQQEIATVYMHLSDVKIRKHERVKAGDIIGYVGNTGLSFGTHCHVGAYYTKDGYILEHKKYGGSFDFLDKKIVRLIK